MGNRGKGLSKGKGGKKGKSGKGKKGGGASKWGDENAGLGVEDGEPIKKRRRVTQEAQDRQRRVKIMELTRAKERDRRLRLSQPNQEPAEPHAAKPKKRKRKKRPRGDATKNPAERPGGRREVLDFSSGSDDDIQHRRQGGLGRGVDLEDEDGDDVIVGFDAGLANYKKLLSTLESGSSRGRGAGRVLGAGGGSGSGGLGVDRDLAAAVAARRMQREGRDDIYGSGSDGNSEISGSAEGEKSGDDDGDSDGGSSSGSEDSDGGVERGDGGEHGRRSHETQESDGDERIRAGEEGRAAENPDEAPSTSTAANGTSASDEDADPQSDLSSDEDEDNHNSTRPRGGKSAASGRSRDEFCRHFVSTPVFPPEKVAALLSAKGRPSFKPVPSGSARGKWKAAGLSITVSQCGTGYDDVVPPPLPQGASISKSLGVLPSLAEGWEACTGGGFGGGGPSKLESLLLPPLTGYRDLLYCGWRDEDAEDIRRSYALHALNHALTSRRRVIRHTARLRKAAEEARVTEALGREGKMPTTSTGTKSSAGDDGEQNEATVAAGAAASNCGAASSRTPPRPKESDHAEGPGAPTTAAAASSSSPSKAPANGKSDGAPTAGAAAAKVGAEPEKTGTTVDLKSDDWQRDQGFTRPKVLILLPFRGLAHELVEVMIRLLGPKTVAVNKDRFDEEYGPDLDDDDDIEDGDDIDGAKANGTKQSKADARVDRAKAVLERKPADWKALLGGGRNVDDMFTLGISLSPGGGKGKPGEGKGVGMRLYCDFYNSDIIIASPVALHRAAVPVDGDLGGGGEDGSGGVDSDFLSSVEVCILDRADVFLMQNWAYVPDIAEVLNSRPTGKRAARADFSRVRPLFLHEQGRLFRQTLVFSAFQDPNLNALASRHLRNHEGVVKVVRPSGDGYICEVAVQAKQVFQRVPCDSLATQDDSRFEYFVGTVLPQVLRSKQTHTAVFIPSYFDYVRVRNHLMKNKASVVNVHEYARGSEVARSRARFFRGDRDMLLYTGRAHFYNRYCIRGIHHLVFYSLPECPQFYPEMVNLLEEAESVAAVTCLSLFTRFERLSLERIVGEERAGHMLASAKNTFLFC